MSRRRTHRVDEGRIPRRGWAVTAGILLIVLGAWGALVPFIGPYFDFAFTPDDTWHWTAPRGWLSVLPGAVAVLAGLILIGSVRRGGAALGAWLAVAAGTWLVIGPVLTEPLRIGPTGEPTGDSAGMRALEQLAYHELLGVMIVFLAAVTLGRHGGTRTLITDAPAATADPHEPVTRRERPAVVIDERTEHLAHTPGAHGTDGRTRTGDDTVETTARDPVGHDPAGGDPVLGPITADEAYRAREHMSERTDR